MKDVNALFEMVDHRNVEAMSMHWRKCDLWKAGIAIAGMLLLLVLMVWVPVSAAGAHERAPGLAGSGTVTMQATPTEDATMTALNKEKLERENDRSFQAWFWSSGATLLSTLVLVIGGLLGFWRWRVDRKDTKDKDARDRQTAQDKELEDRQAERTRRDEEQKRWLEDRETEREKRAEERFQSVVEGLSSEREEAKVGAAIMLRTFLRPGYEQFYTQTFDLAVAHLRLPRTPHLPEDPDAPLPLTTLSQALIAVFKEVFPLARSLYLKGEQPLVARGIQLDNAYLEKADLEGIWMPQASLRNVDLSEANLSEANLSGADLRGARLSEAKLVRADLSGTDLRGAKLIETNLSEAKLIRADLRGANLSEADLSGADLNQANLSEADLTKATLSRANLSEADLTKVTLSGADLTKATLIGADLTKATLIGADLTKATLSGARFNQADLTKATLIGADLSRARLNLATLRWADLSGADLNLAQLSRADLMGANLREATLSTTLLSRADLHWADLSGADLRWVGNLENANLYEVKGLTKEQLEAWIAKGAIIDEASSSQLPISPSPPSQSHDAQTPSAPPAQVNPPPPDAGESGATSSQQGPGS